MIRAVAMWFWRRRLRRMLVAAGCHDVRFIDERRRFGFQVAGEIGIRAGYGENDFQHGQLYRLGDRRDLKRARVAIQQAATEFTARTIPHLAIDGRPPDIGGTVSGDLIRFG